MNEKYIYIINIVIFLHGLGRLTCSGIDALPLFPGAVSTMSGLADHNDLTGYAGGNFLFLVGRPKPDRP